MRQSMSILSVLNPKGGSGKTTISTNLARSLHERGHSVLIVDSDPQGSARDWHAIVDVIRQKVTYAGYSCSYIRPMSRRVFTCDIRKKRTVSVGFTVKDQASFIVMVAVTKLPGAQKKTQLKWHIEAGKPSRRVKLCVRDVDDFDSIVPNEIDRYLSVTQIDNGYRITSPRE